MASPREQLDALIDLFVPDLRSAFLAAIQDIVDTVLLNQLIEAIQTGDVEGAFRAIGYSDAAMRPLTAAIERAFETGGVMTGRTFPQHLNTYSGRAVFRFDVRNSRAEAWLRDHSSTLITRIGDETRTIVRNTMTVGMQDGRNPRNTALDIVGRIDKATGRRVGGVIGLTEQQEYWVRSTRTKLVQLDKAYFDLELRDKRFDRTVAAAIRDGKPLPVDVVDKLVNRYKDNALKYRGDTIARTEALQSLNRAEWEATKQAVDLGATKTDNVRREWDSAGDSRVRWSHRKMNGQRVGVDEPFVSPSGAKMMHPGDTSLGAGANEVVACRCRVRTVIDWLADID
jgi:hypothetical protein